MDFIDMIELEPCPECGGPATIELEGDWCAYVVCCDCGSHTAELEYTNEEEMRRAVQTCADLWNLGKAVPASPGT